MTAVDYIEDESLIPEEKIVITLTKKGYIKRLPVDTYKTQNRGGVGIKGMSINEEDFVLTTPYTYNLNDKVGIHIKKEDIKLRLKKEISQYEN